VFQVVSNEEPHNISHDWACDLIFYHRYIFQTETGDGFSKNEKFRVEVKPDPRNEAEKIYGRRDGVV